VIGTVFGVCYALIVPPMQAPDEFAHVDRAYGIAEGTCVAAVLTPIPLSMEQLANAFPPKLETQRRIDAGEVQYFLRMPLDEARRDRVHNQAANMYSCFPYLPGALGIEVGRLFNASPAGVFYLDRFANLLAYLVVVGLALWLIPDFQLPLLCLALTPMALSQASSASWDGVAYSTAFLLCAYILKLAWDPDITALQLRHYLILGAIIVAASLCKTDAWLMPLLIVIPAYKFKGRARKIAAVLAGFGLAMVVIAAWNYVNRENVALWIGHIKEWRQIDFAGNAQFLYQHPILVFQAAERVTMARWQEYASEFIGKLGWLSVKLPDWAVCLYFATLGLVALTSTQHSRLNTTHRLACLIVIAMATASIFVGMWCAEVPVDYREGVLHGAGHVPGVQGRYFIPFGFPLLLFFSNGLVRLNRRWLAAIAAVVIVTVHAVALQRVDNLYYLSGPASAYYENKLVKQLGLTGEDARVYIIRGGKRQWVKNASWIAKHGFHWPEDVLTISAVQMQSIPEGDPITEP
jgi:uncharacterized membrane protein